MAARFRFNDAADYDLDLVRQYCHSYSRVLDLGAGTCVLSSRLTPYVKEIVAVDFVDEFLSPDSLPSNITPVVSDIRDFRTSMKFDVIMVFGVFTYILDDSEVLDMYKRIRQMLNPGGVCIIKHQVGVLDTVYIDKFSEEFQTKYTAIYRHLDHEMSLFKGFFDVEAIDIYPPHLNRWDNTHFYAFVCKPAEAMKAVVNG